MKLVQIGTIGHYAYALATAKKYDMDFAGICFPDAEDRRERPMMLLSRFGFAPKVYEDYREMLEVEKPDIAVINTVMADNGKIAMEAL